MMTGSKLSGNPLIPNMNHLYGFGIPAHLIPGLNPLMPPGFLSARLSNTDDIAADDSELGEYIKSYLTLNFVKYKRIFTC